MNFGDKLDCITGIILTHNNHWGNSDTSVSLQEVSNQVQMYGIPMTPMVWKKGNTKERFDSFGFNVTFITLCRSHHKA